jgi:hypothetical protein
MSFCTSQYLQDSILPRLRWDFSRLEVPRYSSRAAPLLFVRTGRRMFLIEHQRDSASRNFQSASAANTVRGVATVFARRCKDGISSIAPTRICIDFETLFLLGSRLWQSAECCARMFYRLARPSPRKMRPMVTSMLPEPRSLSLKNLFLCS